MQAGHLFFVFVGIHLKSGGPFFLWPPSSSYLSPFLCSTIKNLHHKPALQPSLPLTHKQLNYGV